MLDQIRSIRHSVTRLVLQSLVRSLMLSRLDYGSTTLAGLPNRQRNVHPGGLAFNHRRLRIPNRCPIHLEELPTLVTSQSTLPARRLVALAHLGVL